MASNHVSCVRIVITMSVNIDKYPQCAHLRNTPTFPACSRENQNCRIYESFIKDLSHRSDDAYLCRPGNQ